MPLIAKWREGKLAKKKKAAGAAKSFSKPNILVLVQRWPGCLRETFCGEVDYDLFSFAGSQSLRTPPNDQHLNLKFMYCPPQESFLTCTPITNYRHHHHCMFPRLEENHSISSYYPQYQCSSDEFVQ